MQVARADLEERLARERDAALAGLDTAKRDHDDALARATRKWDAVRCAHDDELSELQSAAAARERRDALHRASMVSSARRSGASFCFMVLRRWRQRTLLVSVIRTEGRKLGARLISTRLSQLSLRIHLLRQVSRAWRRWRLWVGRTVRTRQAERLAQQQQQLSDLRTRLRTSRAMAAQPAPRRF